MEDTKNTTEIPKISNKSTHFCKQCEKPFVQENGRKEKLFCSSDCRQKWWNSHIKEVQQKAIYKYICVGCNAEFSTYGNAHRKYCSHKCYANSRVGNLKKGGVSIE
ncbi:MAG: hypothetical protein LBN23_02170 [Paludibacter sp.]|nr:hypothetical protein [Paludibacter sp.]